MATMPLPFDPQHRRNRMRTVALCLLMLFSAGTLRPQNSTGAAVDASQGEPFDIVIVNGRIVDGTGSPWYSSQIGIRAGRIAAIGDLTNTPRRQTIDALGKVVAPGFIDPAILYIDDASASTARSMAGPRSRRSSGSRARRG